jgi:hypothetical protein
MQGWLFRNTRFWNDPQIKALVNSVPKVRQCGYGHPTSVGRFPANISRKAVFRVNVGNLMHGAN